MWGGYETQAFEDGEILIILEKISQKIARLTVTIDASKTQIKDYYQKFSLKETFKTSNKTLSNYYNATYDHCKISLDGNLLYIEVAYPKAECLTKTFIFKTN